jgi:hypothetical protein
MAYAARLVLLVTVVSALAGRSGTCTGSMASIFLFLSSANLFLKSFGCVAAAKDGAWCVCRADQPDASLQKTLDYACGAGADCNPIQPSGACFAPDTVRAHCSYAANSFFQRNNQNPQACVLAGTATLVTNDPSKINKSAPALCVQASNEMSCTRFVSNKFRAGFLTH